MGAQGPACRRDQALGRRAHRAWPPVAVPLLLLASLAHADVVDEAIAAFDAGDYAVALARTAVLPEALPRARRSVARVYRAAARFELKQIAAARVELEALLREDPDMRVDATLFPPAFVALAEQVRSSAVVAPAMPAAPATRAAVPEPPVAIAAPPAAGVPVKSEAAGVLRPAPSATAPSEAIAVANRSTIKTPLRIAAGVTAAAALAVGGWGLVNLAQLQSLFRTEGGETRVALDYQTALGRRTEVHVQLGLAAAALALSCVLFALSFAVP